MILQLFLNAVLRQKILLARQSITLTPILFFIIYQFFKKVKLLIMLF